MKTIVAKYNTDINFEHELCKNLTHSIANDNWNINSDVNVSFNICYDDNNFHLFYLVEEPYVKAVHKEINSPVYEDSCVEFFIAFDNFTYYNFEFNCIGNVLGQYGSSRVNRTFISKDLLKEIIITPSLGRNKLDIIDRKTEWTIAITLPKKIFSLPEKKWPPSNSAKCNFIKCGDKLIQPHYLSWSPVVTNTPDFHDTKYFGKIIFT